MHQSCFSDALSARDCAGKVSALSQCQGLSVQVTVVCILRTAGSVGTAATLLGLRVHGVMEEDAPLPQEHGHEASGLVGHDPEPLSDTGVL